MQFETNGTNDGAKLIERELLRDNYYEEWCVYDEIGALQGNYYLYCMHRFLSLRNLCSDSHHLADAKRQSGA